MESKLLSVLATRCREHLLREKVLVVPSLAIGHQLADAVAQSGTPWVNLRLETARTIADAVTAGAIAKEGRTVLSRAQALALIELVCDRVLDGSSYFARLADRPGLHRAIQKAIDDLRHAGIQQSSLRRSSLEDARKGEDLFRILEAYEAELEEGTFIDRVGVLDRAIALLEAGHVHPWAHDAVWMVAADVEPTVREQRLIDLASGRRAEMLSEGTGAPPFSVSFARATGEENEIRNAIRTVLAGGETMDDAEIAYTVRDPYLPLLYELTSEYAIPCTFAEGIPSHFTTPGQGVLAFLRWVGEGWHAADLYQIAGGRIARILRASKIGWGRDRYLPRLETILRESSRELEKEENEGRRARLERAIEDAKAAVALSSTLLAATEAIADSISFGACARAAAAFVKDRPVRNEVDGMAREGLARMFLELGTIDGAPGEETVRRSEVTRRLADAVRSLHVAASNPRPGHLHVAPVRAAGWSLRGRLFVVGLDDERHPGSGLQDPILLDRERESIGMPIVGDRPEKTRQQFRRLLSRSAGRAVTFSWSSLRLKDRREQFASPALLEVFRESSGNEAATFDDLSAAAPEVPFVDSTLLSAADWWVQRGFSGAEVAVRQAIHEVYPGLGWGAEAEAMRAGPAITPFDGKIDAPGEELDPRRNGRTYSASQLERLAGCPFRYFLERMLRITPLEETVFDPDNWLQAREFGTLLHEIFQKAMEELRNAGQRPTVEFLPRMREIAEEVIARWKQDVPPPGTVAFNRRRDDVLRSCEVFLRTEQAMGGEVTPEHFEYAFDGFDLQLGAASIRLRGFIDRIDRVDETEERHVWDYKTGLTLDYEGNWRLACGTKVQHALYARAVEAKLGGKVTRSGYLFPTPRGRGARIEKSCSDAELRLTLNSLSDVVSRGWFPHAEECRWCEFESVCGDRIAAAQQTLAKCAANPDDPAVRAWLQLQGIE